MSSSTPATMRVPAMSLFAPEHRLSCAASRWRAGMAELRRRGRGERESGAFLLGDRESPGGVERRRILHFAYYEDLDPTCLESGIVVFDGAGYGPLWRMCRESGLAVVADVHTHPGAAWQSDADRRHPMVAMPGHFAIIVPDFARRNPDLARIGLYEYLGAHQWRDHSGASAQRVFHVGFAG